VTDQLEEIRIIRQGDGWRVTRHREGGGESALVKDLHEAYTFIAALYDKHGQMLTRRIIADSNQNS